MSMPYILSAGSIAMIGTDKLVISKYFATNGTCWDSKKFYDYVVIEYDAPFTYTTEDVNNFDFIDVKWYDNYYFTYNNFKR